MLVLGAWRRRWCWCCELAARVVVPVRLVVRVVETGCWRGAGAGCRMPVLVLLAGCARDGDRLLVLGAGCQCWCWCCELAVHVVERGCWCWVARAGAGAGCRVLVL